MPGGEFKVLKGIYIDIRNGRRYGKGEDGGEVFNSDLDLDTLFAGKFERLDGRTKIGRDEKTSPEPKNTIRPTVAAKMQNKDVTGKNRKPVNPDVEEDTAEVDTDEVIDDGTDQSEVADESEAEEVVEDGESEAEAEEVEEVPPPKPKAKVKAEKKPKAGKGK